MTTERLIKEFLEKGGKITQCQFSIDPAVKFARQTIKPHNKQYQKATSMMSRYDNVYRTPDVQTSITKMREVELDYDDIRINSTLRRTA
tara:strand:- start:42 stop:308 length:267 start_codon:yes stop_codon:yes gene_type:complete